MPIRNRSVALVIDRARSLAAGQAAEWSPRRKFAAIVACAGLAWLFWIVIGYAVWAAFVR